MPGQGMGFSVMCQYSLFFIFQIYATMSQETAKTKGHPPPPLHLPLQVSLMVIMGQILRNWRLKVKGCLDGTKSFSGYGSF